MKNMSRPSHAVRAILLAGLVAGCLDLTAAIITTVSRGRKPSGMFQAIASGVLGPDSFRGGTKTAALGVFLHFVIAFGAAVVYYLASRKLTFMVHQALISGVLYGTAVYFFMQRVVLPLSAVTFKPSFALVTGLLVHIFCVGLPIALIIKKYS